MKAPDEPDVREAFEAIEHAGPVEGRQQLDPACCALDQPGLARDAELLAEGRVNDRDGFHASKIPKTVAVTLAEMRAPPRTWPVLCCPRRTRDHITSSSSGSSSSGVSGSPAETVTAGKQRRLITAASHFLQRHPTELACRFDVLAITENDRIQWIRDAFRVD